MEMHFIYFPGPVSAVTLLNDCGLLFPDFSLRHSPPPVFYATPPHRSIRSHRSIRLEQSRDNPRKSAHRTYIHLTRKERKRREREIRPSFSYRFHYLSLFFLPPPRSPFSLYRFLLLVSRNAIQRGVFDNDNTVTRATGSRYASTSNRKW